MGVLDKLLDVVKLNDDYDDEDFLDDDILDDEDDFLDDDDEEKPVKKFFQKFGKKTVTARRPLLYGVGCTCLYLAEGSCRYPNTGTYRETHAAYLITN